MATYTHNDIEQIAKALGKFSRSGKWYSCLCPAHNDHNPSLSICLGDNGTLVLNCFVGCDPKDIFREIKNRNLLPHSYYERRRVEPLNSNRNNLTGTVNTQKEPQENHNRIKAQKLWEGAIDPQDTQVKTYLTSRGIHLTIPPSLRFFPAHDYYDKNTGSKSNHPCMIAAITRWSSDEVIAVHRTYLRADGLGKAAVSEPKKMLAPMSGGAVRFGNDLDVIAVGEGIETCLSYYQETGITTLAVLSTSNFKSVALPPVSITKQIIVLADNDAGGIKAAEEVIKKWRIEGRKVYAQMPETEGDDFNDLLMRGMNV